MEFLNLTNNTIYLDDIDVYLPFEDIVQELDTESTKKSKSFQLLVKTGKIKVVEVNNSRIEKNMQRLSQQFEFDQELAKLSEEHIDYDEIELDGMNILIQGHFEDAGGYAKVNRNLATGLQSLGANVFIKSLGPGGDLTEIEAQQLAPLKRKPPRKSIHIDSIVPSFSNISTGIHNILYTTVESYTVPNQFIQALNAYNEVWVVSDFCKEVLEKYTDREVFVLPDGIDVKLYLEEGDAYKFRPELNPFVFVSVFGWSYRKGYDVLLKSYLQEFSGDDPVSLLIMSRFHNNAKQDKIIKSEIDKYIKEYGGDNPAHIVRCSKVVPEYLMPALYRACDAYAGFSRGEGFFLPAAEASLCGLPIIATNATGQTMFLKKDNSFLLEPDEIVEIPPGLFQVHYWDNQKFPKLTSNKTIKEAGTLMRDVFVNYNKAKLKNKKLQKLVRNQFDKMIVAKTAYKRLEQIWSQL